jgi:multiple sugar transport system permease protein
MAIPQRVERSAVPGIDRPAKVLAPTGTVGSTVGRILFVLVLAFFSLIFLYPMVWLLAASLKSGAEVFSPGLLPSTMHPENFTELVDSFPRFPQWFLNSALVSVLAAGAVTLSSAFVAFGFSHFTFPGRDALFGVVLATMMLPGAVTIIPTFLIWKELGFFNTLTPLWAGNLFASAFYIFMLRQFFLALPREMFEAAKVDGANYFRMWRSIVMPLTAPALLVVLIFELKAVWTDLMKPLMFLQSVELFTLPRGLMAVVASSAITGEGKWHLLMAASVITTLPMVILFFVGQRYFVEGIATTGSKG